MNSLRPANTTAAKLNLGRYFWFTLIGELRRRGAGIRESGAFLLGRRDTGRVSKAAYYDDLCPGSLDEGYIVFTESGYVALTKLCQKKGLAIIADVHTHPGKWTGQSEADQGHPMMPRDGHMALIVPSYARSNRHNLRGVGAYRYNGNGEWSDIAARVTLSGL